MEPHSWTRNSRNCETVLPRQPGKSLEKNQAEEGPTCEVPFLGSEGRGCARFITELQFLRVSLRALSMGLGGNRNDVCLYMCLWTCRCTCAQLRVHIFACMSVWMCLRAYMCTHVSLSMCMFMCMDVCVHGCLCTSLSIHVHTRIFVSACVYIQVCVPISMSLSLCIHVFVYVCECMCMHSCMYTSMCCTCACASKPDETNGRSLRIQVWSQTGLGLSFSIGKWAGFCWIQGLMYREAIDY